MSRPVLSESATIPAGVLDELCARLERAAGPDSLLDSEIAVALGMWSPPRGFKRHSESYPWRWVKKQHYAYQPHVPYTASLEAALALSARVMPDCDIDIEIRPTCHDTLSADVTIYGHGYGPDADKRWSANRSAPVAVCLATLRALAAIQKSQPSPPPSSVNEASTESAGLDNQ